MSGLLFSATLGTALACGLMGGAFFAFSTLVMGGLRRLPDAQGLAAMQAINRAAITPLFMLALLGAAAACAVLAVVAVAGWGERRSAWLLAGSLAYLIGAFGTTIVWHVPRNDALATVDPTAVEAAARWATYLAEWMPLNHVRALASVAAAGLLTAALVAD